jgi:hypothetical protein
MQYKQGYVALSGIAAKLCGFVLLVLPFFPHKGEGQIPFPLPFYEPMPKIRFVIIDDYIRASLIKDWDAHANDTYLLERGYCLGWQIDFFAGEPAYRATEISIPDSVVATVASINFSCKGRYPGHLAQMHTHPPTSCKGPYGPCFRGGAYAYQCEPSDADRRWLNGNGDPFSIIQCSREATIHWFPDPPIP